MKKLLCAALVSLPLAATAGNPDLAKADTARKVIDARCTECHTRVTGGDASGIYTRTDRRVTTAAQLQDQIHTCNSALKQPLFPEEEAHLATYLNSQYYHFKP